MTRLDWGQTIRAVEQGVEKPVILDAWKAIEVFDPVSDQTLHGKFRDARLQNGSTPGRNGFGEVIRHP